MSLAENGPSPQFRNLADKHIIFDDQYHGHANSFGRDNQHRG
jgi:hypothetical protein